MAFSFLKTHWSLVWPPTGTTSRPSTSRAGTQRHARIFVSSGGVLNTGSCGGKFATCPSDRGQVANLPPHKKRFLPTWAIYLFYRSRAQKQEESAKPGRRGKKQLTRVPGALSP